MKFLAGKPDIRIHIAAVAVFIVASFVYFYPVLEGKVLRANDSTVSRINSKEIQDFRDETGKEPLWTNSIFSGMPAYLISTKYPGNLAKKADNLLRTFPMPVSVLFLSMLGFYILLLIFGMKPWLALAGSLAYGLSSFFFQILAAGHNTQAIALAYMPPVIGGIYYAYRKDAIKGALLTAFFLALEISANHPQITYYAMMCALVFGIVELVYAFRNKTIPAFLKTSAILIIPFIIAAGINFAGLFTTWEYGKYSIRGKSDLTAGNENKTSGLDKNYILNWSYGVGETFNLLIPNFRGGESRPFDNSSKTAEVLRQRQSPEVLNQLQKYWGEQPGTDGPHYVGAIVFFLFVLGLFLVKGPEKWWLFAATILSVMLAWGKNFMPFSDLFISYFPGYNKFRAVTMTLVIAEFCIPLLGFLALKEVFSGKTSRSEILKSLKIAAGITGGFILLVLVIPGIAGSFLGSSESTGNGYPSWLLDTMKEDRKALLRSDGFRSLVFILLSAGLIIAFVYEKLKMNTAILVLTVLIVFDLWMIDKRYLNAGRFERPLKTFKATVADEAILKDKSIYRVLNMTVSTFNDNSPTSYFHKSIGGYHGAKMERYQELIDSALYPNMDLIRAAGSNARSLEEFTSAFNGTYALNMLNTKYLIINPGAPPLLNQKALGNTWFAEKATLVNNADEEISGLRNINPANEALIDKSFAALVTKNSFESNEGDTIELVSYKPNELKYRYSAGSEKLALFSEIYYPAGWKSYIDGKEIDHFRADYVLRAMVLPAGQHDITFSFQPGSYRKGNTISLVSSIILILLIAGYFALPLITKREAA